MTRNCDICGKNVAEYMIKKMPKEEEKPTVELYLCSFCASDYIKQDTVSIVKISKTPDC
jgi:protein-arginine kinase activator protein McsA